MNIVISICNPDNRRQNHEVPEFETSLDYIERVCLTNNIKNNSFSYI